MSEPDLLISVPGFRDYFPEYWREIDFILQNMRDVALKYGYEEYEGPGIEQRKLIEAKSGSEIMKETFQLRDRNEKDLLLRPEQTPTLARMLAREQQRYKRPLRWFSIPRLFRDETAQKGRVREFWQLNVDILGESEITSDAEVIAVAIDIFRKCGLKDSQFKMIVNHRDLLNSFIENLTSDDPQKIIPTIDKKLALLQESVQQKIMALGRDEADALNEALLFRRIITSTGTYRDHLLETCTEEVNELIDQESELTQEVMIGAFIELGLSNQQATQLFTLTSIHGPPAVFLQEIKKIDLPDVCKLAIIELEMLANYLEAYGVLDPVIYDASLARGLDYYTGIVFEAFDTTGEIVRALCGGGRYDDLVAAIGGNPLAGTGFGMGELVLLELLKLHNSLPSKLMESPDLYLAPIKKEVFVHIISLATSLREEFNILCNPFAWRVRRHLENADTIGAKLVLLLGPKDIGKGVISVRKVSSGEQFEVGMDDQMVHALKKLLE
ncbi:MAG: histidine--tRNA ligase [Candidatus Kariarchaeaceae archaeon]|jgi:histidyl-tRNA synthetase